MERKMALHTDQQQVARRLVESAVEWSISRRPVGNIQTSRLHIPTTNEIDIVIPILRHPVGSIPTCTSPTAYAYNRFTKQNPLLGPLLGFCHTPPQSAIPLGSGDFDLARMRAVRYNFYHFHLPPFQFTTGSIVGQS